MSAVWRAARAAVRRRRLQTIVIGVVVGLSTTMAVVALGLLAAASGPFDQAYAKQQGAHAVSAFDPAKVSAAQLTAAARTPAVDAVAGPYGLAMRDLLLDADGLHPFEATLVGRDDPGGPVDRLNVWRGRWATAPGEIVFNRNPVEAGDGGTPLALGTRIRVAGGPELTVVGSAFSVSDSAQAWVSSAQMTALHPTVLQMLYRFAPAATNAQVASGVAAATTGVPADALLATSSYLALRAKASAQASTLVPFLVVFGILGLAVAVLIVANVVSGAVVAGIRHIGVLKALGFTPDQVLAVYLTMVSVPAMIGCVLGTALGNALATPLLHEDFKIYGAGGVGVSPWVSVAALLGIPAIVALSALLPALRARRLSAIEAISAGSTPHAGRGRWIQRRLTGSRLPRAVSLGLGLPFARPGRSALTMAAVILGVTSVTFALGLARSVTELSDATQQAGAAQVEVYTDGPGATGATLSDTAEEAMLRSLPGTAAVFASANLQMRRVGAAEPTMVRFYRADLADLGYRVLRGQPVTGAGQVAVTHRFLARADLDIGDQLTLALDGKQLRLRIVAEVLTNSAQVVFADWSSLALIKPGQRADSYEVRLDPDTDVGAYLDGVRRGDPGVDAIAVDDGDAFSAILLASVTLLTLMLGTVAALGVFNTVVLNARERRRDLGMLKSIGMTPGQVTAMMVTSMAALGALSGLVGIPIGIATHRLVVPLMVSAAQIALPDFMLHVYSPALLTLLLAVGIAIAALGAFVPARAAARTTIAEVLHNE
ncbi:ABC transporter permease [Actinoplanes sp. NPDC026623]|uniref:ABC transporter permease n=1 Tax=Actinoplanes sp. NPDC026623 TaxID=3155610 RepID=UPI0033E646A8